MGRLTRWVGGAALATGIALLAPGAAAAFDGFGPQEVESTYGDQIRFDVSYAGGAPDRLEILLRTPGSEAAFVAPVDPGASTARHVWDTSLSYVTPNTLITYQWRAISDGEVILGEPATHRYEDDRPGIDWRRAQLGEATVHWYGDAEDQARRFGELTALGVERAQELLGTQLAGPVDVFVYAGRDDFFGALGPGAREWTGAAAYPELRTIFMWLGGGSAAYLEQAMVHEVTHIVFFDATENPFHEPARWLNEGVASWMEDFSGDDERAIVELEAAGAGLFSFEAIGAQFPIGERGGRLSYAQGTTMIDMIVERYGEPAIARIMAAYRAGASDGEALEAGTGVPADELYAAFFAEFGVDVPTPIVPDAIAGSNVDRPAPGTIDPGGVDGGIGEPTPDPSGRPEPAPAEPDESGPVVLLVLAAAGAAAVTAAFVISRRGSRGSAT